MFVAESFVDGSGTSREEFADVIGERTGSHVTNHSVCLLVLDRGLDTHVNVTAHHNDFAALVGGLPVEQMS